MKTYFDVIYYKNCALDIYLPDSFKPTKTIVYVHGGGLVEGDKRDVHIERFAKTFTDNRYAFVSVNYNLYPSAKWPSYIEEVARSIKFLEDNLDKYGLARDIYISGSSAGSYIIMMLCVDKHYLNDVKVDSSIIKGWISDDGQMTDHFNVQEIELKMDPWIQRITKLAPLYYVDKDIDISRLLLIYYDQDLPMRKEQNLLFYETLKHFNPHLDVDVIELHGTHCQGTSVPEKDGSYRFVNIVLDWIKWFLYTCICLSK